MLLDQTPQPDLIHPRHPDELDTEATAFSPSDLGQIDAK
jgi:hypothetical protein